MSHKALKVVVESNFRAVSCPGVHLPSKDDIYLSMCFMGQYRQSECLPAVFPLLFREKMTFEKIFRHAVDPGDIAVMLEYETVTIELVQLIPPVGDTLACLEEDAQRFLFPEPKLVPSFSGVDREVLKTRAPHFPGIAPRLEFFTKTTIIECSAEAKINIQPNVPMRSVIKRNRKHLSRPRTSSPQRKQPQNLGWRRDGEMRSTGSASRISRPQSLSPLRAGNTQRLAQLNQDLPAYAGFMAWSQRICLAFPLCTINQLLFTFDQDIIRRLERYQKTTPVLLKHMMPLTATKVLTLQDCGSLIGNRPRGAGLSPVLTENGKRSKSVFRDSLRHQRLYGDLFMGPHTQR